MYFFETYQALTKLLLALAVVHIHLLRLQVTVLSVFSSSSFPVRHLPRSN